MSESPRYFAAHAGLDEERARLRLFEDRGDGTTIQRLLRLGVSAGWRCLEVGAGNGSVARWLGGQVGASGQVVATDIDTRFLDTQDLPNVSVRTHDITVDDMETDTFDLVHCRSVLGHLRDPEAAVAKMVAALRPGGWLLAEEFDYSTMAAVDRNHPLAEAFDRATAQASEVLRNAGVANGAFGRHVPGLLRRLGLVETGNQAVAAIIWGGSAGAQLQKQTVARLRDRLIASGAVTESELADRDRAFDDPEFSFVSNLMVAAWGRRPD